MRKLAALAVLGMGAALAAWVLWPSGPDDDESLIRESIAQMADAAGKKDLGGILEQVSERYRGEGGTRDELKGYLFAYLRHSDWVSAVPARVEVEPPEEGRVRVRMVVLLVRGPAKTEADVAPEAVAGTHAIEAVFAKESDGWRVVEARRREASAGDFFQ